MADLKISQLTGATTPLAGTEVLPIVQSSTTKKVAVSDLTAGRSVSAASLSLTTTPLAVGSGGSGATTITANQFIQGNGTSAFSSSAKLYTDGTNMFSDCSYRPQVQSGATNNTAPTAITISNKTTGAEAAGLGAALEFQYVGSGGGYAGGKIAGVSLGDPFTADMVFYPRNYGYAEAFRIKSTGDLSATGNLIQGTATKGINFTANTPAAGMTSQLLNWYEEGTWTPSVAPGGGTIAYTSSGRYTKIGRLVTVEIRVDISSSVGGAGGLIVGAFPFAAPTTKSLCGATREDTGAGFGIVGSGYSTTEIYLTKYDGTYPGGTNYGFTLVVTYSV
jgi:hypothetical protein